MCWLLYVHCCWLRGVLGGSSIGLGSSCERCSSCTPQDLPHATSWWWGWGAVATEAGLPGVAVGRTVEDEVAAVYGAAADELLRLSGRAKKRGGAGANEQVQAWLQLAWHYNKVSMDEAKKHGLDSHNARASSRAVDIAAHTWPYWLSWPETQDSLSEALGPMVAARAIDSVRMRHSTQRWQRWWRPVSTRAQAEVGGGTAASQAPLQLPRPHVLAPFSSLVMVWQLHRQQPGLLTRAMRGRSGEGGGGESDHRGVALLDTSDLELLTRAALRLHQRVAASQQVPAPESGATDSAAADTANELLFALQNDRHNQQVGALQAGWHASPMVWAP
jgi:hypothetical protein